MCGIVSYIGHQDPVPILIKGLRRLEYRGYDSAGLALLDGKYLSIIKKQGRYLTYLIKCHLSQFKVLAE